MLFQRSLFDGDRLDFVSEPDVRRLIDPACPLIWQALNLPWDDFQHSRQVDPRFRDLTEAESAWWLHTQIKRSAGKLIEDCPEFGLTAATNIHGQFHLNLDGELVIVFKKLIRRWSKKEGREVLVRSNYPTKHNREWWAQRKIAGALDAPRIVIGYEEINAMTGIRIHVGYPRNHGRRFNWIYEMPDQVEAAKQRFGERKTPEAQSLERRGFEVEPRREIDEERGAV